MTKSHVRIYEEIIGVYQKSSSLPKFEEAWISNPTLNADMQLTMKNLSFSFSHGLWNDAYLCFEF